jgi:hypothetical protein
MGLKGVPTPPPAGIPLAQKTPRTFFNGGLLPVWNSSKISKNVHAYMKASNQLDEDCP